MFVKLGTHLTVLGTSAGKHCDFFESVTLDNLEKTICQPKRGRQKGDKRETEGRQEGDRRETRGRQEGDKRETGAQRGLGWSFVILQQKNPFSEPKRIAYRYVLLTGLVLVFVLWLELSHCLQNNTTVNSYLALGDNAGLAALCCSLLLSAALCCSVLLSAALCYPLLLSAALCCPLLLSAALCCSLLLSVALCCSLLLSAALCCSLANNLFPFSVVRIRSYVIMGQGANNHFHVLVVRAKIHRRLRATKLCKLLVSWVILMATPSNSDEK